MRSLEGRTLLWRHMQHSSCGGGFGIGGTGKYLLLWLPITCYHIKSLNISHHKLINLIKSSTVLLIVCIEIGKLTVQNVKPKEIIPFLWLISEPFKLHKCDRVLKTRPCNAMSNGEGKDMLFRCHIHNAHKVNMSMGQRMQ